MSSRRFRGPPAPLPVRKASIICLLLFVNECNTWLLYSYLPFLVHFLLPDVTTMELGYWSALLGFAYYFGALFGSLGWGVAADHLGRRPVLLTGVLGSGILSCVFGFSRHYWMSVALRFLWGLLNSVGVSRTALMEILDDSNSAQGMVLYSVVSGMGRIVGPLIGTWTSRPALHFAVFRHSIFETYPFALPALLSLFWACLVWLLALLELEETLPSHRIKNLCDLIGTPGDQSYSMLASGLADDLDMDESGRFDKKNSAPPFSPPFASLSTRSSQGGEEEASIELQSQSQRVSAGGLGSERRQDSANSSSTSKAKKKKGLTFNSFVQLKTIDSPDIAYKKLKKITADDTPSFYSADERDSNYTRSRSYVEALRDSGKSGLLDTSFASATNEDDSFDGDMDASSRSLVSTLGDTDHDDDGKIEKYTNGSELLGKHEVVKDFRQLSLVGTLRVLMRSRLVYYTSLTYFFLVLSTSALNEIFPLWLVIPSSSGGFGFNSTMLGLALFCSGPVSLAMQLCAFPSVAHHSGLLSLIRNCLLVFFLMVIVLPFFCVPAFQRVPVMPQVFVIVGYIAITVAADWAFVITYVFINNSCYTYQRATVNGIMQALACVAMMLASLAGSSFFALCESNTLKDRLPWPFHYAVVFWLIALLSNLGRQATYYLHRKIQKVRREPLFPRYSLQMEHFAVETGAASTIDDDDDIGTDI